MDAVHTTMTEVLLGEFKWIVLWEHWDIVSYSAQILIWIFREITLFTPDEHWTFGGQAERHYICKSCLN